MTPEVTSIMDGVIVLGNVEAKVDPVSYKLKFVSGSSSTLLRPEGRKSSKQVSYLCIYL